MEKKREHYSKTYDNAPMPNMQRLTWKGIALHAGKLPGYPASHGCIRLPKAFAEKLYGITRVGTRVIVADELTASLDNLIHPGDQAPVDAETGVPLPEVPAGQMPQLADAKPAKAKAPAGSVPAATSPAPVATGTAATDVHQVPASQPEPTVPEQAPAPVEPVSPARPDDPALQVQPPAQAPTTDPTPAPQSPS